MEVLDGLSSADGWDFSSSPSVKCVCKDLENVFKFRNQTNQRLIAPGLILSDSGNPRVTFWGGIYA